MTGSTQHVVVFGVDGVRLDTLRAVRTPQLDAIAAAGFQSACQVSDEAPTTSGPGWATIATGVSPSLHGVLNNHLSGHRLASFPDFLTRVRRHGGLTYAAASWGPLVTTDAGGPIFAKADRLYFVDGERLEQDRADQLVADDAAAVLGTTSVAAAFVYLGNPDHVAHEQGTDAPYRAAIEQADRHLGQVLDAIAARPGRPHEQWTVIVVTDHGHRDGGGHGQHSHAERTAWVAACGPGVPTGPVSAGHMDVAPHVLASLGITIHPEDGLLGAPFLDHASLGTYVNQG